MRTKRFPPKHATPTVLIVSALLTARLSAQFFDGFDDGSLVQDPSALNGWAFFTGDGSATMTFQSGPGYSVIRVDATLDKRNVWYALIKRRVSAGMDLGLLNRPGYDFRIEARIRTSHAPRRVNLSLNTQRTTDFHSNLMEFDIADTAQWHTISMTTRDFDAVPGDLVYGQLALMDWGFDRYRVDLDYFKVDIVNADSVGPDQGIQVPYHPPVPAVETFAQHIPVDQDCMVDPEFPDTKFNNWSSVDEPGKTTLLTVGGTQTVILRWNLAAFAGKTIAGSGLLEMTTHSLERTPDYTTNFGLVRVVEIVGGDPAWNQKTVTTRKFCQGKPLDETMNPQMIIDFLPAEKRGNRNLITISNPVLQRLVDGKTLGIALRPLGAICASFAAMENAGGQIGPRLHFNAEPDSSSAPVGVSPSAPASALLGQNFPNPFNPRTTVRFTLDRPSDVRIAVYNVQGRRVKTLLRTFEPAGEHALTWDGRDDFDQNAGSGVYIVEMRTDRFHAKRKMTLLR